ncbi:MAG: T9SS type A sorting domain-containing protein [candidate division KSB1 bacterium]|nr:T9SS type A sorting domain-containing protein [candidate division KSB1 bacterium]MDZ7345273.1 T9SS type A sorting domain-containing protein [candidate division KSB1 bacterium]
MDRRDFFKLSLVGMGMAALTKRARALEYYPMPSDKKWAVLYGTWCGSARDAAVWISEGMGGIANVFDVRENPDLSEYEYVVVGGAIRSSVTRQELQNYITRNKEVLQAKVRGLFAVCGNMGRPVGPQQTAMFIDNHLAKLCGVSNVLSRVFLGRITKSLMDPQTAEMMKNFEDYDNLKRSECMAFGQEVLTVVSFVEKVKSGLPQEFELDQNHPNPFNESTKISYSLNKSGQVMLQIYDANGKIVRTLIDNNQDAGSHFIQWDGRDDYGNSAASGIYLYLLKFEGNIIAKQMVKVK